MQSTTLKREFVLSLKAWSRRLRWVTHPITLFVSLEIVWLAITLIWVIWFVGARAEIADMAERFGHEFFSSRTTVAILVIGCVLLGVLLVGTILLFVFGQRQSYLARQQRNFVSSVTHELKSPLASLQLGFETIQAHKLDEATSQQLFEMIKTDIERLKRLVDQILVTGRMDRGIMMFEEDSHQFLMRELIDKICEKMRYLDPQLATRLKIDCSPTLTIRVSRSAMTLILNNLIENAIKYSPKASPITVGVDVVGKEVFLYVRDEGMGLDKKDLRRVFKMFQRSDSAVRKAIPGTGLGLYIVKSAVQMLGGKAWAESAGVGQGSTFYASLPTTTAGASGKAN